MSGSIWFLRNVRVTGFVYFGPYLQIFLHVTPKHSGHRILYFGLYLRFGICKAITPNHRVTLKFSFGPYLHEISCVFPFFITPHDGVTGFRSLDLPPFFRLEKNFVSSFCLFLSSLHLYSSTCYVFCKFT